MSWGLVSDVHGNLPALEAALLLLEQAGAVRLAFLGDYLGKGDSDGCVERIRQVGDVAIIGNRDLDWQDRVSSASKDWVLSLPRTASVDALLLSHGDSRLTPSLSTSQIGQDFIRAWLELEQRQLRIWAFGHSHFARTWRKVAQTQPAEQLRGDSASIDAESKFFVNVGTAGLPFPGKGGPSVAVVDFARLQIRHLALPRD